MVNVDDNTAGVKNFYSLYPCVIEIKEEFLGIYEAVVMEIYIHSVSEKEMHGTEKYGQTSKNESL
jgi:hypothetical protein